MKVIFESYFSKVQISNDKQKLILEIKNNSVNFSEPDFINDIMHFLNTIDANLSQSPNIVLVNLENLMYMLTNKELESIISLSRKSIRIYRPGKIAIVYPQDNFIAICADILIQTFIQDDINTKGFRTQNEAESWLAK